MYGTLCTYAKLTVLKNIKYVISLIFIVGIHIIPYLFVNFLLHAAQFLCIVYGMVLLHRYVPKYDTSGTHGAQLLNH